LPDFIGSSALPGSAIALSKPRPSNSEASFILRILMYVTKPFSVVLSKTGAQDKTFPLVGFI